MADLNTAYQRDRIIAGDNKAKLSQIDQEYSDKYNNMVRILAQAKAGGGVRGNNTPMGAVSTPPPTQQDEGALTMQGLEAARIGL